MFDKDGVYHLEVDVRGAFIRAKMRERYPRIEDEFAIMAYGTAEERAAHAEWRAEVKAEADRRFPKECARAAQQDDKTGGDEKAGADEVRPVFFASKDLSSVSGASGGVNEGVSSDAE